MLIEEQRMLLTKHKDEYDAWLQKWTDEHKEDS